MEYNVQTFQPLKKVILCLMLLVSLMGASAYNNVNAMLRGYASKYAYYVGGLQDINVGGYSRQSGIIYVWSDWAKVNSNYTWDYGKCWKIYIPYSGMVSIVEVKSVDLSNLYDVYSNIEGSTRPSYDVDKTEVIYRKIEEVYILSMCLLLGVFVTNSVINRVRR